MFNGQEILIIKFKVQTSMFNGQEILIIKFKVQTSMFKGQEVQIIIFKVQTSMFKGQEVLIIKFKVQTSMFKGQCLYLWWSFTFMLGEETAAVSIEEFFEGFNLQTEFCTLVGVFHA